jgi:hypothetical protein
VVTVEELAATKACYDVVLNMEVVEHVAVLPGFLGACASTLGPGGMSSWRPSTARCFSGCLPSSVLSTSCAGCGAAPTAGAAFAGPPSWKHCSAGTVFVPSIGAACG